MPNGLGLLLFLAFLLCMSVVNHSMNKWLFIQALRGIAILAVVVFHLMLIEIKYSGGDLLLPDFLLLGQSGVDLFFVISGFVMGDCYQRAFREEQRDKAISLEPTFPNISNLLVLFLLDSSRILIRPNWVNSSQGHQAKLFSSFLLPNRQPPLVMVAWSLIHELWFYAVFAVLFKFNEKRLLSSLLVWGMIVATANVFAPIVNLSAGVRIALHPYTFEFIIGALVAIFVASECSRKISSRMFFMVVIVLLLVGLPLVYAFDILKEAGIMRVSIIGTLYGLLMFSLATLEREKKFIVPRFLQSIGDISYTVYLSHVLILSALGRLWVMANPARNSLVDNMIACLLMVASVVSYGG